MLTKNSSESKELVVMTKDDGSKFIAPAPKATVLDEDDYVNSLDQIIKRDFFPDLEKLTNQHDWLEATAKGDFQRIAEIKQRYAQKRGGSTTATPNPYATPNFSATPMIGSNSKRRKIGDGDDGEASEMPTRREIVEEKGLDAFVTKYTSEDNQNFSEIMEKAQEKTKERYWWLFKTQADKDQKLIDGREQSGGLIMWKTEAKNTLMYTPDSVTGPVTSSSLLAPEKEIYSSNTRLQIIPASKKNQMEMQQKEKKLRQEALLMASDPTAYLLAKKNAQKNAKLDLDDLLGTPKRPNASPVVSGYGFLTTPQITPGEDGDEPPMTWGDINATPLLLDPTDTPIDAANADGPQFRVPEMSKREKIAIELAEKNSREKKTKQLLQAQANAAATAALNAHVSTPMRMGTGGRTPLSKAAQIVAGKVFAARSAGKGGNSTGRLDSQLRASYGSSTPSTPFRTPGSTPSHRGGMTPSVSVVPQSPASNTKPANPSASLTDNLLNI